MRGRAAAKRAEPGQEFELLLAEPGNVDEALRPGRHREQAQEHDFLELINHLARLPVIGQILEIFQKNNRFVERPKSRCR
jgi:hypothetical protein